MRYTDGFNKIESVYSWVSSIFEEVFNGENTTKETFCDSFCKDLIKQQQTNYNNTYGTEYKLTTRQIELLKKRYNKLKKEFILRELKGGLKA
jgi:hypothetical protein